MKNQNKAYFAFPFIANKYVLGFVMDKWIWFYNCYFDNPNKIIKSKTSLKPLFKLHNKNRLFFKNSTQLDESLFNKITNPYQEQIHIYFDTENNEFKIKSESEIDRIATHQESLAFCEIIASQNSSIDDLKLRILETYLGFIPSFQYSVEVAYKTFFSEYKKTIDMPNETFVKKESKKEFDKIYKEQIVPFALENGFQRHTKTSKRLVKKINNGLSVFIFFERLNFGYGSYSVKVEYFDKDIGSFEDDNYLAVLEPNFPYSSNLMIHCDNLEILHFETQYWMRIMELYTLPFIEKNNTHQSILKTFENTSILDKKRIELNVDKYARKPAYYFNIPSARKEFVLEIINQKKILKPKE